MNFDAGVARLQWEVIGLCSTVHDSRDSTNQDALLIVDRECCLRF